MYRTAIILLVCESLSLFGLTVAQLVEVYNFKDDCEKRLGSDSYISTCDYNFTRDYYLDEKGKLTDNGIRYLNASRAGLVNRHVKRNLTFTFRYGEVRWRATMMSVNCKEKQNLPSTLEIRPQRYNVRWHLPSNSINLLILTCLNGSNTVVYARKLYGDNGSVSFWKCDVNLTRNCLQYLGVLEGPQTYTLRWTADELTWLINNVTYFHINDDGNIPRDMMVLTVYDLDTVPYKRSVNTIVESVSVWQDPVDARTMLSDLAHGSQTNGGNELENKTTLVKVYSFLEQCADLEDYLASGRVWICDFPSLLRYTQKYGRRGNAMKDVTDAEVFRQATHIDLDEFDLHRYNYSFRYGEVRWKAQPIVGIRNVLNIEGPPEQPLTDIHNSTSLAVMLMVHPQEPAVRAQYFNTVRAALLGYMESNNTDKWTCTNPFCALHPESLWLKVHDYTLRWTPEELVWLIDDILIYRLTDKKKIPRYPMMLRVYDSIGGNSSLLMPVKSVSIWQNRTILFQPNFTVHFYDNFTGSQLDEQAWTAMQGHASGSKRYTVYNRNLVSVKNGLLQLKVRQSNDTVYFGRVDGMIKNDLLYPAEVEWRMRFRYNPGFLSVLTMRAQQSACKQPGKPLSHDCISRSIPAFGFACDEWGKVKTTLDLGLLHPVPDEFDIKIPIDRQRKRYDGLRNDGQLDKFHMYRIVWTGEYIAWYIDGYEIDREDFSTQYHLSEEPLSVSMGTFFSDHTGTEKQAPARPLLMEIDYVVLWSQVGLNLQTAVTPTATSTPFEFSDSPRALTEQSSHLPTTRSTTVSERQSDSHTTTITLTSLAVCCAIIAFIHRARRRCSSGHLVIRDHPIGGTLFGVDSLPPTLRVDALVARYIRLLEIPENCIDIQELNSPTTILGNGSYGIVLRGIAKSLPTIKTGPTVVAVKILTGHASAEAQKLFADEVKIMAKAGGHVNIINILGVVNQGRPLVILEYCKFGSLQSYLKNYQANAVYIQVDIADGTLLPFDDSAMKTQWLLVDEKNRNRKVDHSTISKEIICTGDLIQFSSQVSRGMEYLGTRRIIHRDLAARNVLVNERRVMKISDFGLARYAEQTYTMENTKVRLPYLWMSPDALTTKRFSSKSDVWSFGVLMHEIFTLGEEPFNGSNVVRLPVSAFVDWLTQGNQMPRPSGAPIAMYEVMRCCWRLNCDDRPTFSQLRKSLDALALAAVSHKSELYVTLAEGRPMSDEMTDCNHCTHSELNNLQRMIGECCAEAADPFTNDVHADTDSAVSWSELPFFSSDSHN